MSKIRIVDQDIIFLSYDEPNAEKKYRGQNVYTE